MAQDRGAEGRQAHRRKVEWERRGATQDDTDNENAGQPQQWHVRSPKELAGRCWWISR